MQDLFPGSVRCRSGNLLPQGLGPAMQGFSVQPLLLRGGGRPGRSPFSADHGDAADEFGQPLQRIFFVALIGPVLLGLDDDVPVLGQALVAYGQQPLLDKAVQGGFPDGETEMDGARHLVDILAARALGADLGDFNLAKRDRYSSCDL